MQLPSKKQVIIIILRFYLLQFLARYPAADVFNLATIIR